MNEQLILVMHFHLIYNLQNNLSIFHCYFIHSVKYTVSGEKRTP